MFLTILYVTQYCIDMKEDQTLTNLITELKRGNLTLCVLSQLHEPQYGYSLLQHLSENRIELEANTLYPMLRRLESQGILASTWDTSESRPRKFYQLSAYGSELYAELKTAWAQQTKQLTALLEENNHA